MKNKKNKDRKKKSILFVVNDIDFFLSHRKKIGLKAKEEGYRFIVCAPKNRNINLLTGLGFEYYEYSLSRGSRNIVKELKSFFSLFFLINKIDPDVLHLVTIKPLVYGGLIARLKGNIPILVAFPGLGHLYTSKNIISTISRFIVNKIYRFIFTNPNYKVIFQNNIDSKQITKVANLETNNIFFTYGSGVDLKEFSFSPLNNFLEIKFLFASRLLRDKGIHDYFMAAKILKDSGFKNFRFLIAGNIDRENPSSISKKELQSWIASGTIDYFPHKNNIKELLKEVHVVVLPSYREGMPKILLEASAIGRAIITTNAPGCDECVKESFNGFKIDPGDFKDLAQKMKQIGLNKEKIVLYGQNSRKLAEERYSDIEIIFKHLEIYEGLINLNSQV